MADQAEAAATTVDATTAPADPTLLEKLEKDLIMVDDAQHGTGHAAPAVFGMDATVWVSVAMLIFIGILIWKKVPALIGGALDKKIAEIREQLDEAKELRVEAEKLKAKYDARMKAADHEAELIIEHANKEAADVVAQAKTDAKDLVARRKKMAEDKISAAERSAGAFRR